MVRLQKYPPTYDVTPQAIFWRPLSYFTPVIRDGEDGLDMFQAASFCVGNITNFDLRRYRGHPDFTVTMYLHHEIRDVDAILAIVRLVVVKMAIPKDAVAWMRGMNFKFGHLERPVNDRLREREARILALKIAAQCPNYTASTEYIKQQVPKYIQLSDKDLVRSSSRTREQRWQQIAGNVVSHKRTGVGLFRMGYADRTPDGLTVTEDGLTYLNNMGFSVGSPERSAMESSEVNGFK